MTTKKRRPADYLNELRKVVDKIQPVEINPTEQYEKQRKEEVENVKESSRISDDYMTSRFTASRNRNKS